MSATKRPTKSYAATAAPPTSSTTKPKRQPARDYDGDVQRVDASDGFCVSHEYTPSGRAGDT